MSKFGLAKLGLQNFLSAVINLLNYKEESYVAKIAFNILFCETPVLLWVQLFLYKNLPETLNS